MGTIRHSIETIFAAVAFAERDRPAEADYLLKSLNSRQVGRTARPAPTRTAPRQSASHR